MANIKIELDYELIDGQPVTFAAPCNCTAVTGLKVYHSGGSNVFTFKDAHGNALTGLGNLFSKGAYVKAILDVNSGSAYLQNADTNAYLEAQLASKAPSVAHKFNPAFSAVNAAPNDLLMIDLNGDYENSSSLWCGHVSTENADTLVNSPIKSGAFYGFRKVEKSPVGHFVVTINEMYPVNGRLWTNMYNVHDGWTGWTANYSGDRVSVYGGDVHGWLNFGQQTNGLAWQTADGTIIHLRPYVNGNVFQLVMNNANLASGDVGIVTIHTDGRWEFAHPDLVRNAINAAVKGHGHSDATTSGAGFMSAADKTRLDNTPSFFYGPNQPSNWASGDIWLKPL